MMHGQQLFKNTEAINIPKEAASKSARKTEALHQLSAVSGHQFDCMMILA